MNAIREWAFSVCTAMVVGGIASMVMPRSGMQKVFSLTLSVFMLSVMLSPLLLQNPRIRLEIQEYSDSEIERRASRLEETVALQTKAAASGELKKIIAGKLTEMGINYRDITININTNGQSDMQVESVEIVIDAKHEARHGQILRELENTLGLTARLGYE